MATQRPNSKYNSTQAELYSICTIMWQSYAENQPTFETFKTTYTAQLATDMLQEIEDARNLPDFQARNQATESTYIAMKAKAKDCLKAWRSLRSYIKSSFPSDLQKPEIEAAGEEHYTKALNNNWSETKLMLSSGNNYITAKTAELTTGGMPLAFPTDFDTLKTEFDGLYSKFTDFEQDETEGTDLKVNANNAIYTKTIQMGEDGQLIFEQEPAKQARFVFSRVKELITSTTPDSGVSPYTVQLSVLVVNQNTQEPISGATITVLNPPSGQPFSELTNTNGLANLEIEGFAPNTSNQIDFEVIASGYQLLIGGDTFTSGQLYSVEAPLQPDPPPVP